MITRIIIINTLILMKKNKLTVLLFTFIPSICFCSNQSNSLETTKSTLKIEDFFPEKHKWTINTGANIFNNKSTLTTPIYFINQVSPNGFLVDRTTSTYNKENNGISGYTSVMYGITNGVSASLSANGQWLRTKLSSPHSQDTRKDDDFSFNGIGLGISYQFYSISDYSIIHGGVNIKDSINSYYLGSTLNWLYDPLVLSLSMTYLDGISKDRFATDYRIYSTSGIISFAVNPEATLHWGAVKDFIHSQHSLSSNTAVVTGISLNTSKNITTHMKVKYGSGGDNSILSVGLTYKL